MNRKTHCTYPIAGALLALSGLTGCDIDKTEEGKMPEVHVEEGKLPKYDVETAEIDVRTEKKQVEVPDVDVHTEKRTVEVPDVDIDMPDDDEVE